MDHTATGKSRARTPQLPLASNPPEVGGYGLMIDDESAAPFEVVNLDEPEAPPTLMGSMMSLNDLSSHLPAPPSVSERAGIAGIGGNSKAASEWHSESDQFSSGGGAFDHPSTADQSCHQYGEKGPGKDIVVIAHSQASVIVSWDGVSDRECPRNWSLAKKILLTVSTSLLVFAVAFGSSIFAPAGQALAAEFESSSAVTNLTLSLWIAGFSAISGPLSDAFGYRVPLAIAMLGLCLFQVPAALATNIETVLVARSIAGMFGSGVYVVVPRIYAELYEPPTRSIALAVFGTASYLGAALAPIAGAHLLGDNAGMPPPWRWLSWLTLILSAALSALAVLAVPESASPVLLRRKAARLRRQTGNWALHAHSEEAPAIQWRLLTQTYLIKPPRMLATEPLLAALTICLSLVHGTLYLTLQEALPRAFRHRGWSPSEASVPLTALTLGVLSAGVGFALYVVVITQRRRLDSGGRSMGSLATSTSPEDRLLPPMVVGAVVLPSALLWFGWSTGAHWMVAVVAGYFIGVGLALMFIPGTAYLLEVYGAHADSAWTGHLVVQGLVAASFPLWAGPTYDALGIEWASSVVAFVCAAMVPVPAVLMLYGARIRGRSRYTFGLD